MPKKNKSYAQKTKKNGVRPRQRESGSRTVVMSRSMSMHPAFPDRVETTVCTCMDAYYPIGRLTAAAGNYFTILANSVSAPFASSTFVMTTGTASYTFGNNSLLIQGFVIGNSPMGLTEYQVLYNFYKVKRYRIEICVVPASQSDSLRLVAIPLGADEIPSAAAANVNLRVLEAQPKAKAMTISSSVASGPGPDNTLILANTCWQDVGKTQAEYMGTDDVRVITATPVGQQDFVGVFLQELNGTNNTSVVSIQVKLVQEVIFYDLINQIQ